MILVDFVGSLLLVLTNFQSPYFMFFILVRKSIDGIDYDKLPLFAGEEEEDTRAHIYKFFEGFTLSTFLSSCLSANRLS